MDSISRRNAGQAQVSFRWDAQRIPYTAEFAFVGAFDVLEHIVEVKEVLVQMHCALKPGGRLLLTVPQHPVLLSFADEYACDVRRYTAAEIHCKVTHSGFETVRSTSFVSLLLSAMLLSRWRPRGGDEIDSLDEFRISRVANSTLREILRAERWLIKKGVSFPVGGSRLIVARRIGK